MWDISTLDELNQLAAKQAEAGEQQREALRKILDRDGIIPRWYVKINDASVTQR